MTAAAVLLLLAAQPAPANEPEPPAYRAFTSAWAAVSGYNLGRCDLPALQSRLDSASNEVQRLARAYWAGLPRRSRWATPPVVAIDTETECGRAPRAVEVVEARIAEFARVLGPAASPDLDLYREIVTELQWTGCCARFRGGIPAGISRRVRAVEAALQSRYGREAVRAAAAAADSDFSEEFGTWDPVAHRSTQEERTAALWAARRWYDERLDRLEASLRTAAR